MPDGIIGRERELEVVDGFLADVVAGPAALIMAGEPGIGKTTLWQKAVERARGSSFLVLSARLVEAEGALAFAGLADLLEPVVDELLPALPEPQRRALAVALLREDPGARSLDQRAVSAATSAVLRTLAATAPVVVAIDDVQWLDLPSARVLELAARRLADVSFGVLTSERVERRVLRPVTLKGALPAERTKRVDLTPLSVAALHDLLKERLGRTFTRRMLVRIAAATGGNPLFALEIARSLPEDASTSGVVLPMPERLLELIDTRIRTLPSGAGSVLLAAAALRAPTLERVKAATGGTQAEWREALEGAENNGIVEVEGARLRFAHPLFATAVYASAPPGERRRVHRRLASLIPELEERARHLALGADAPDDHLAAALDVAADHARARGAPESAAELAEWARALTPEHRTVDVQRRTIEAAEYRFHAGELRAARELLEAVLVDAPAGPVRADALRLLGEIRYHQDSFPEAMRLFEQALDNVGDDPRVASGVELRLALCLRALGRFELAEVHTRRAVELTEQLGDPALEAEALAVMARLDVLLGRGLDETKLNRALQLEDPHRQVAMQLRPSKIAGDLLLYVGQLERSVQILERERERVLARGEESDLPFILSHLTWAECWRGRLAAAATHAEEALDIAYGLGGPSVQSMALAFAAVVAAYQGDAVKARQWAQEGLALARSTGWHTAVVWGNWALGALAISLEDARAADEALGGLTKTVEEEGLTDPIRTMFLGDEIEALIGLGELDRAARLAEMLDATAERLQRGWALVQARRCRALLLATSGDLEGAAESADDAVAIGETIEHRLELARTLLVAGQIQRRLRRKAAARQLVARAVRIFEEAHAGIWARRAQLELERAGGYPAGNELTSSEQRVATLAAAGLTTREIAAQLFMSPKTVEAHLANTYRKLGIRSRAELGARFGAGLPSRQN